MTSSPSRPDLRVSEDSRRLPTDELISRLRDALGTKLVAYVASLHETRTIGEWAKGKETPSREVEARLRLAYRTASILAMKDDPQIIQGWFQGANEHLGERAPASLLRDGELGDFESKLVATAREFTA